MNTTPNLIEIVAGLFTALLGITLAIIAMPKRSNHDQ